MPYSGVVYRGDAQDEDAIERICAHEHKTAKDARACGEQMARETHSDKP